MLDLLHGIRVVSFNHFLLGPMGMQMLADLGADVVAVEPPGGAWQRHWSGGDLWHDGQSMLHLCANRNKRAIALDLKSSEGREIALRLIDTADVVAENYRPGTMEQFGLDWATLRQRKPDLIYASATGYGADGPYADKPGQDLLAQALFGLMTITGHPQAGPRPIGASVVDHHAAALFALGIIAALFRRSRTGQGCRVDASLMQAALDLQTESLVAWANAPHRPSTTNAGKHIGGWYFAAPYGVYATRDGFIALSLSPLAKIAEALDEPRLATFSHDESWQQRDEIAELISARLVEETTATWSARMTALQIWHAPVQDYAAIAQDPQVAHMNALTTVPASEEGAAEVTLVNHPLRYDGEGAEVRMPPQPVGAQTGEILAELGFTPDEMATFAAAGIVRLPEGAPTDDTRHSEESIA